MDIQTIEKSGFNALRKLCRENGVKYGNATTPQMRAMLKAKAAGEPVPAPPKSKAAGERKPRGKAAKPAKPGKAPKGKAKGAPKGTRDGSLRQWLADKAARGSFPVHDAIAYAESTGRSAVTVRRQASELGIRAKKGIFSLA